MHFIWENYGHNVTVTTKQIECRINESKATYDIIINRFLTNDSLQPLLADLSNTGQGIDLMISKLKLCHNNCLEQGPTISITLNNDGKKEDAKANRINIWMVASIGLIILFLIVLFTFCFIALYIRLSYITYLHS